MSKFQIVALFLFLIDTLFVTEMLYGVYRTRREHRLTKTEGDKIVRGYYWIIAAWIVGTAFVAMIVAYALERQEALQWIALN